MALLYHKLDAYGKWFFRTSESERNMFSLILFLAVVKFTIVRLLKSYFFLRRTKRPFLAAGALASSSLACSWVMDVGSVSFGILAFFLPSVM